MVAGVVLRVSSCVSLCPSWRRTWKDTASGADGRPFAPHCRAPRFLHFFVFVYNITGALLGRWRWSWGFGFCLLSVFRFSARRRRAHLEPFMRFYGALRFILYYIARQLSQSSQLSALSSQCVVSRPHCRSRRLSNTQHPPLFCFFSQLSLLGVLDSLSELFERRGVGVGLLGDGVQVLGG